jgi:hypothetical protein
MARTQPVDDIPTTNGVSNNAKSEKKESMEPNVKEVVLGNLWVKPWYRSYYSEEIVGRNFLDRLYVCQWCFKYTKDLAPYLGHTVCCLRSRDAIEAEEARTDY